MKRSPSAPFCMILTLISLLIFQAGVVAQETDGRFTFNLPSEKEEKIASSPLFGSAFFPITEQSKPKVGPLQDKVTQEQAKA